MTSWRLCLRAALGLVAFSACAKGSSGDLPIDAADRADAALVDAGDEPHVDAAMRADAPPSMASALLLTEVVLAPSTGEYIEITNPNDVPYDLSTYYLTDSGFYFRLPAMAAGVEAADFLVKFPGGAQIQPKASIVISLDTAANYQTVYGAPPTYSIASGTGTMEPISLNGAPSLTNTGELVVLFQWDAQADVVKDVDLLLVGVPTAANGLVDKSGFALDGPDGGTATTTYKTDARTITAQPSAPAAGKSTKRIALETGNELQTGSGNGIDGDDETSENTGATWDTSYSNPTPGTVPTGLLP